MGLSLISKFIVITLLSTILIASVEPNEGADCPFNITSYRDPQKRFNVILKDKLAAEIHYKWLSNCCKKSVKHASSVDFFSKNFNDDYDFSVENSIYGYSALFNPKFVEDHLSKHSSIQIVEVDARVKVNHVIPRAVRHKPNPNLDRIDQARFPLNGKYIFPDSAGSNVHVYIVDTGILITHEQFEGRAIHGGSFCPNTDDHGHGTHVAGIVAGKTFGVANKAKLVDVKVLDAEGFGSNAAVIAGLAFILSDHKSKRHQKSVVNMSLGGDFSAAINQVVKLLTDNGIHVVVAAGNEASDACQISPASETSAITVGATEDTSDAVTDFSNIGKCVDIFAPGQNILSAVIASNNGTRIFSGTSQATPHVAGTLALIIAKYGNFTPAKMAKILFDLATKNIIPSNTLRGSPNVFLRVPRKI